MYKNFFQTESNSIDLHKFQEQCSRQGLLLCILSSISVLISTISILMSKYNIIYTVVFSLIDGSLGIIVGAVGYRACRSNTYTSVNRYKYLTISYSILFIASKFFSGLLDIRNSSSSLLVIILFLLLLLFLLSVCFYYSVSVSLYAKKLRKTDQEAYPGSPKPIKRNKQIGESSLLPLTSIPL